VYDRLILGTGSLPIMPPIPGFDRDGVFAVNKDIAYLTNLQQRIDAAQDIVVIGGGFIGIEVADEINKLGGKTDDEFCIEMEQVLESRGIGIRTGIRVESVEGNSKVESVQLSDGTALKADLVISAIGATANVELAKSAGLHIGTIAFSLAATVPRRSLSLEAARHH